MKTFVTLRSLMLMQKVGNDEKGEVVIPNLVNWYGSIKKLIIINLKK